MPGSARSRAWCRLFGSSCRKSGGFGRSCSSIRSFWPIGPRHLRYGTSCGVRVVTALPGSGSTDWCRRTEPRTERSQTGRPALADSEVRSPLSQRVLMLLYCPFRVETRAPQSWSWALRITLVAATVVAACLCIRWPDAAALEHRQRHGSAQEVSPVPCHGLHRRAARFLERRPGGFLRDAGCASRPITSCPSTFCRPVRSRQGADRRSSRSEILRVNIVMSWPSRSPLMNPNPGTMFDLYARETVFHSGSMIQAVSVRSSPQATTEWLTFEPSPARVTQFRNLVVEW